MLLCSVTLDITSIVPQIKIETKLLTKTVQKLSTKKVTTKAIQTFFYLLKKKCERNKQQ